MKENYISHATLNSGLRICQDRSLFDVLANCKEREKLVTGDGKFGFGSLQYRF